MERARETAMACRIVRHRLVQLAKKVVVAQFCKAKDHESTKAQSVCVVRKRDAVFAPSLSTSLPPRTNRFVGVSLDSRQPDSIGWYGES